jgi:hypothetical protein
MGIFMVHLDGVEQTPAGVDSKMFPISVLRV